MKIIIDELLSVKQSEDCGSYMPFKKENIHNFVTLTEEILFFQEMCKKPNKTKLFLMIRKAKRTLLKGKKCKQFSAVLDDFFGKLPLIKEMLLLDASAIHDADPAANSLLEIIFTYTSFKAIISYRIAHEFYLKNLKMLARAISENAHSITGVDINPGATIGNSFCIDHGTGIVIGETAIIGDNVRIYQGVTLGAKTLEKGHDLRGTKRHPTIENNVILYSGTSILGGDVVIGENSIIGGNTFITNSVPPNSKVMLNTKDFNYIADKGGKKNA